MAFHVACPITCKKICFCKLGFPQKLQSDKARGRFFDDTIIRVSKFLKDPFTSRPKENNENVTVQIPVPKVDKPPPPPAVVPGDVVVCGATAAGEPEGNEALLLLSSQKRASLQRKAAVASMEAEDYAKRFESGDLPDASKEVVGEDNGLSHANVMCRMCFHGENEGSLRARRMLPCKDCGKKYHRSCLKSWSRNRDLFHWSLWTCPSCRICEVCWRTGDPNKFTFCKRCDGAYHCYCLQPPHKTVSSGPFLCPKHTRCHSCGSSVPGNGLSLRWFLGYTCCDACGRLFMKGNYCPVCLKVYRDSESTPMVCCDICQRWVHCQCDGISDEKYMQFQVDGNLQYVCATCRGECYQVKDHEDAVKELWRRKDEADRDVIATLRVAAGLPTEEDIFSVSPFSDDEESAIALKNEFGRSLKFSLKGLADKSPKKTKEYGKKFSSKKHSKKGKRYQSSLITNTDTREQFIQIHDAKSPEFGLLDNKNSDVQSHLMEGPGLFSSSVTGVVSHSEDICSINQTGVLAHKFDDEVNLDSKDGGSRVVQIKSNKPCSMDMREDNGESTSKSKAMKGPKLVIHLGARNKNLTSSPRSDASSYQREQALMTSCGNEDMNQPRMSDNYMVHRHDSTSNPGEIKGVKVYSSRLKGSRYGENEGNLANRGKITTKIYSRDLKYGQQSSTDGFESKLQNMGVLLGKRSIEGSTTSVVPAREVAPSRGDKISMIEHLEDRPNLSGESNDDNSQMPAVMEPVAKDSKPLLKLKFKNPYLENQSSWAPPGEEEKSSVKGLRSKRKRPSPLMEKTTLRDESFSQSNQDNSMDEFMDANWILKKLGKDAVGKRVEVHQSSDNSWHTGSVAGVFEGTSTLSVKLDNGRSKTLQLGKHGIRFVPQKQKRTRTRGVDDLDADFVSTSPYPHLQTK